MLRTLVPIYSNGYRIFKTCNTKISTRFASTINLGDELSIGVKRVIERKWWSKCYGMNPEAHSHVPKPGSRVKYILSMFPYPSGRLHLGHVRVYTLSDVLARYHRLQGHQVIHPMGWDSFGLPAENAARDGGIEPAQWTRDNIQYMKDQIVQMGCCFDWDREISTCEPNYFKWSQWLFLKLYENNLVYKKRAHVFWDPIDQTVLAEEQVDSDGKSWRSGAKVERKLLSQWFVRATAFVKDLVDEMKNESLREGWRDIVDVQNGWIGDLGGFYFDYQLELIENNLKTHETLRIWTSSLQSLASASHVILKPDHPLAQNALEMEVKGSGFKRTGFEVRNPLNGAILPLIVASNESKSPLIPESADCRLDEVLDKLQYPDLAANDASLESLRPESKVQNTPQISNSELKRKGIHIASLKLRDWLVSRQRKWGTPIPILNCLSCGVNSPVPYDLLPITNYSTPIPCPKCASKHTKYESDTLDTFFDSSWYYLRYLDPKNDGAIFDPSAVAPHLPVTTYVGGKEHATLHLYYARVISHFLHGLGLIPVKETFARLIPVGVVVGETFITEEGKYLKRDQVQLCPDSKFKYEVKESGEILEVTWEKMSKSKYNGIEPESIIQEYGIDTMRFLCMAEVAPTSYRKWPTNQFPVLMKFQPKIWSLLNDFVQVKEEGSELLFRDEEEWHKTEDKIFDSRNYYLKGVNYNYGITNQISVAISKLQGLTSDLKKIPKLKMGDSVQFERTLGSIIICLYPVMPTLAAEMWQAFRGAANLTENEFNLDKEVWAQNWPDIDMNYKLDLNILVKGKEWGVIKIQRDILDTIDLNLALEYLYEHPKCDNFLPRGDLNILSFKLDPSYRANLDLRKLLIKEEEPKKKKPKKEKVPQVKKLEKSQI